MLEGCLIDVTAEDVRAKHLKASVFDLSLYLIFMFPLSYILMLEMLLFE